jgi:hypothetical protein
LSSLKTKGAGGRGERIISGTMIFVRGEKEVEKKDRVGMGVCICVKYGFDLYEREKREEGREKIGKL